MGTEENKAIVRRLFEEVWNKWNTAVVDELIGPNCVVSWTDTAYVHGTEEYKQFVASIRTTYPDWNLEIDEMIAEGDTVVVRSRFRGTHLGTLVNAILGTIPPTGKQVRSTGIYIYRIAGGKIMDNWILTDVLGVGRQLGAIPPAPAQ